MVILLYIRKVDKHSMCDGKPSVFGTTPETAIGTVGVHTIGVGSSGVSRRIDGLMTVYGI